MIINSGNFWYSSFTSKAIYATNYLRRRSHFDQSLTSLPGKVMEKIILGGTEKPPGRQHSHWSLGFRRAKSCLANLIAFHEQVTHPAGQGEPADIILLDFSIVFNTAPHSVPLDKIFSLQLGEHIMAWVSSWVRGQAQRVTMTAVTSDW